MSSRGRFLVTALVVLLAAAPAAAQSPFAMQNVGQRVVPDDARMVARGFGMTVNDSLHPGFKNVASFYSLRHVALQFTGYGESASHDSGTGKRHTYRVYTPDLRVGLPVVKDRLAVTLGISIFRSSQFQTKVDSTWSAFGDTIYGNHQFVREGSLFRVPLGVAWEPVTGVSVGASLNLVRGAIRDVVGDVFEYPSVGITPFYQPNSLVLEDRFSGNSTTLGVLLRPGSRLRLGLNWTPAYTLHADHEEVLQGVAGKQTSTWVLSLPAEYRAGLEVGLAGRWKMGGDAMWSDYRELAGRADWQAASQVEYAWSAGFERIRAHERHGGAGNLPLRLSAAYRRWAYTIGDEPVDEWTWTAGTGFPFRGNLGQLDLALAYGRIGSLATNGRESSYWRLTVSVTGLESWW